MNQDEKQPTRIPYFKEFPFDYMGNPKIRSCSIGARGLLKDFQCLMHFSKQYGHLLINEKNPDDKTLARLTHTHPNTLTKLKSELIEKGVIGLTPEGIMYSEDLIKNYENFKKHRESQLKNPKETDNKKVTSRSPLPENETENDNVVEDVKSSVVGSSSSFNSLVCPLCDSPVEKSGEGFVVCTNDNCNWGDRIEKAKHKT